MLSSLQGEHSLLPLWVYQPIRLQHHRVEAEPAGPDVTDYNRLLHLSCVKGSCFPSSIHSFVFLLSSLQVVLHLKPIHSMMQHQKPLVFVLSSPKPLIWSVRVENLALHVKHTFHVSPESHRSPKSFFLNRVFISSQAEGPQRFRSLLHEEPSRRQVSFSVGLQSQCGGVHLCPVTASSVVMSFWKYLADV